MVGRILGLRKTELGDRPNLATELGGASSIAAGDARARSLTGLHSRSIGFPMLGGPRSAEHGAEGALIGHFTGAISGEACTHGQNSTERERQRPYD
jgi:hypothetical protein